MLFLIVASALPAVAQTGPPVFAHRTATAGDGSSSSPWTGWETAVAADTKTVFVAGYFESDTPAELGNDSIIECQPGAVLRRDATATGRHLFSSDSGPENVQITGCTFDNDDLEHSSSDIHIASSTGQAKKIAIRDNRWINQGTRRQPPVSIMGGEDHGRWVDIYHNRIIGGLGAGVTAPNSFAIRNMSDVRVDNNHFSEFGGISIQQYSKSSAPMRRIAVRSNVFENLNQTHILIRCTWQDTEVEGEEEEADSDDPGQPIEGITLADNIATTGSMTANKGLIALSSWQSGFTGDVACRIRDVTIHGNVGRGHSGHFIIVGGVDAVVENASVVGNSFDGREPDETELGMDNASSGVNAAQPGNRNIVVAGNTFRYTGRGCIRSGADNVTIANNSLEYCAQNDHTVLPNASEEAAIMINGTTGDVANNVTIIGNTIYNSHNSGLAGTYGSTSAIRVSSPGKPARIQITGNTIWDDRTGDPGMSYGLWLGRSGKDHPSEVTVAGNQIFGYIEDAWLSDGATSGSAEYRRYFGNVTDETYSGWAIGSGLGSTDTHSSCLYYESAADAIFEDRNCDGVKDTDDEYIGATSARSLDTDRDGNPEIFKSEDRFVVDADGDNTPDVRFTGAGEVLLRTLRFDQRPSLWPGICGASPCLVVDLDADGNIEASDVCLVDGGVDADCDGNPE